MEITAIQKNINTTPRKLRLVADMVRNMKPTSSLTVLRFTNKLAATALSKAINTALANAKQQGADSENLSFKSLEINEGYKMKRMRAGSRGFRNAYALRTSQIRIVLTDDPSKIKDQKSEIKVTTKKLKAEKKEESRGSKD